MKQFVKGITVFLSRGNNTFFTFLFYFLIAVMMYISMLANVIPDKLDVSLYSIADRDIISPVTIENKQATIEKQNEAAEAVEPEYTDNKETAQAQIELIEDLFIFIENIKKDQSQSEKSSEEKIKQLRQMLAEPLSEQLSNESLRTFLHSPSSQLAIAKDVTINAINETFHEKVTADGLIDAKRKAEEKVENKGLSNNVRLAVKETVHAAIVPNYFIDTEATKIKRQQAMESVDPVMIRQGQVLIKEGHVIHRDVLKQLEIAGLLDDRTNLFSYVSLAILVIMLTGVLYYFLKDIRTSYQNIHRDFMIYFTIFFLTILIMKIVSVIHEYSYGIGFIVPVSMGTMLIKMLINERIAIVSALVFSVVGSILFNTETVGIFNAEFGLYILFSSLAAIFYLGKHHVRSKILKAGFFVSTVNIAVVFVTVMIKQGQFDWVELGLNCGFALISGFLAAVLTLGFMPFFDAGFGILSTMKLIELSNPNHPLLRNILMEAPGTYHHSVMVANLSETACEAIGANGLLARVGSYYHDVGKTRRPHFFIENQMNMENPHDKISPQLSKTIIVAHPYDGAEMLRQHRLPKEIIDIAEQHHGTTLLKFFYHKANSQSEKEIPESEFRYPGPKAQSKEAAIVGIADAVEAAVRSFSKPTPQKIETLVRKIINDRLEDGQFDECDLTFKELNIVATTICETLQGIFHSRIEYPEEIKKVN